MARLPFIARTESPTWEIPWWVVVFGAATAAGFLFGGQIYVSRSVAGEAVSWAQAFYWSFGDWYEWALLSPAIFWLCRRWPLQAGRWLGSVVVLLIGGCVIAVIHAILCSAMAAAQIAWEGREVRFTALVEHHLALRLGVNLATFFFLVAVWQAWDYRERNKEREKQIESLGRDIAQARLAALRMQINPHFLFNTLNTVSSLMLTNVTAANQVVSRLGMLLRETLDEDQPAEIPLQREVAFILRYLEIDQFRFGDRFMIALNVDPDCQDAAIPAFLLQPLVENAVRHAMAQRSAGGRIIARARRHGDHLELSVTDNGPGRPVVWPPPDGIRPNAIGLRNTRRRLSTLYPNHHRVEIAANEFGGLTVTLTLPYRPLTEPKS